MADNPTKHSDIIEPGNPFDEAIKGMQEMIKLLDKLTKDIKESAKEWQAFTQKQNASTKEGQKNLKKAADATQKLTVKEKEALKIKQALEREQAKLNLINSKEYKQLLKTKEATRAKNAELKKTIRAQQSGTKSTNTWAKATGSFAAKFNTLGNVAAMALAKIATKIKSAITQFISFEKIIGSNQATADKYDVVMGRLKGSFEALNRAIALGDYNGLAQSMKDAADAAGDYVAALDVLGDTQNALNIQTARSKRHVKELQEIYNDTSKENDVRLEAAQKASKILADLQENQERIAKETFEAELERVQGTFKLTDEQISVYRRFIENYGLLTDDQVTALGELEAQTGGVISAQKLLENQATNTTGSLFGVTGSALSVIDAMNKKEDSLEEVKDGVVSYDKTLKDLSETMGFDLSPVIDALIGTNDEQRTSIVNSIIAYDDQLAATQKLINSNVTMTGSILLLIAAEEARQKTFAEGEGEDDSFINESFSKNFEKRKTAGDLARQTEKDANKVLNDALLKQDEEMLKSAEKQETDELQDKEDKKKAIIEASIDVVQQGSDALFAHQQRQADNRFKAELEAANGNAEEIERIQEEQAKDEQKRAIAQALVNGALGASKTIANLGFPLAIPALIAQAAVLAFQIAAIKSVQFEEGGSGMLDKEGHILQGASHGAGGINPSIEAEGGEYFGIINKHMTRKYQSELPGIFESINNGRFHDVFSRSNIELNKASVFSDPYTKKMYELMQKQGITYTDSGGNQVIEYMSGKKRIIRSKENGL